MSRFHIIGYVDPVEVSAGAQLAVKVSCNEATYSSKVHRLGPAVDHADAPPVGHQVIEAIPQDIHERLQFSRSGS